MRAVVDNLQVAGTAPIFPVDIRQTAAHIVTVKRRGREVKKDSDLRISFRASKEDHAIIEAGMKKHGLPSASDILRMALRRFKEYEGLKVAS